MVHRCLICLAAVLNRNALVVELCTSTTSFCGRCGAVVWRDGCVGCFSCPWDTEALDVCWACAPCFAFVCYQTHRPRRVVCLNICRLLICRLVCACPAAVDGKRTRAGRTGPPKGVRMTQVAKWLPAQGSVVMKLELTPVSRATRFLLFRFRRCSCRDGGFPAWPQARLFPLHLIWTACIYARSATWRQFSLAVAHLSAVEMNNQMTVLEVEEP